MTLIIGTEKAGEEIKCPEEGLSFEEEAHSSSSVSEQNSEKGDMAHSRLHYIPLALFFYWPTAFLICYAVALSRGHVNAYFTFISDTGTLPPEQHLFAQLVNMGAALFAYFVYIRYVQVDRFMKERYNQSTPIANVIALTFGFISSLGMSFVGNFPELSQKEVHLMGAFLAFVSCCIYVVFQGYLTFKMLPYFQSKAVAYTRIFLGILGLMFYFGAQITVIVAFQLTNNKEKDENAPGSLIWKTTDGGYQFRAASVVMEWLLVIIFDVFILSFVSEFKKFKMEASRVKFLIDIEAVPDTLSVDDDDDTRDDQDGETGLDNNSDIQLPINIPSYVIISDGQTYDKSNPNQQGSYPHNISMPTSHSKIGIMLSDSKIR